MKIHHVYGPGDNSDKFIPWLQTSLIKNSGPVNLTSGIQLRDFIYIDDQIKAIYAHKDVDLSILNIGSGRLIKIKESQRLLQFRFLS